MIEEFKKLKREKTLIPILVALLIISVLLSFVLYRVAEIENIEKWYGRTGKLYASFLDIHIIFVTFFSVVLSYFLLTKEYINDTWGLLITKVFRRTRLVFAKYIVFMSFYLVYALVFFAVSTLLVCIIVPYELNGRLYVSIVLAGVFMSVFYASLQFCIQLLTDNLTIAVVIGLAYRYVEGKIPDNIPILKYLPCSSFSYLVNENHLMDIKLIGLFCAINILCSIAMVAFCSKRFYS